MVARVEPQSSCEWFVSKSMSKPSEHTHFTRLQAVKVDSELAEVEAEMYECICLDFSELCSFREFIGAVDELIQNSLEEGGATYFRH